MDFKSICSYHSTSNQAVVEKILTGAKVRQSSIAEDNVRCKSQYTCETITPYRVRVWIALLRKHVSCIDTIIAFNALNTDSEVYKLLLHGFLTAFSKC